MKHCLWFFWPLLLTACSYGPVLPPVDNPDRAWQIQQRQLAQVSAWKLGGRIGIHTEDESWQARIDLQQHEQNYTIHLTGPLGQGSLRLQGDDHLVALSDGEHSRVAEDAEDLLYHEMGWRIPVKSLRYWALGLPAPGSAEQTLNPQGLLEKLQQDNWTIEFRNYVQQGAVILPGRLFISNHRARIRLIIDQWQQL
ncbi:MAG: lipoprotein insertase outer membrane protein LolB [Thiohalomonadaceae bacterium]